MNQGSPPVGPRGVVGLTPGTVLLGRYRIVNLLGRGGTAEVYRADDLRLGEEVALKFLSSSAAAKASFVQRLHTEVRNGRRVAHPNVCRIYDIVETEDRQFISMEFVAGEDLAFLLRQVGRLPYEKALRISRDLCAGVAAAHDVGLLHRDLKPANVMIDRHGSPKITDFGISGLADELPDDQLCGTLNYMAPEQFGGGGASFRSDLYAVGLIMHELFTGKPVFDVDTIQQLIEVQQQERRRPSTIVSDLDQSVERVILKCLAREPSDRPRTAREIVAMLPGHDRIEEAVLKGETPSPDDIAYMDFPSTLSGRSTALLLSAAACAFAAILALTPLTMFYGQVPLEKSPEALTENARQVAAAIGMPIAGLRAHSWFRRDEKYLRSRSLPDDPSWRDLRTVIPGPMEFVTYWIPPGLAPQNSTGRLALESPILLNHLNSVVLDSAGHMKSFRFSGEQGTAIGGGTPPLFALLTLAGLPAAAVEPLKSVRTADGIEVTEWIERTGGRNPVRIVESNRSGTVTAFAITRNRLPGGDPRGAYAAELGLAPGWESAGLIVLLVVTVVIGIAVTLRNARRDKVDASGAIKVAAYVCVISVLSWACGADHAARLQDEWVMVTTGIGGALFAGFLVGLLYAAMEPELRRRSPRMIVAWTRVMRGWLGDSLVGQDLVIATCAGIGFNLWWRAVNLSPQLLHLPRLPPYGSVFEAFSSLRGVAFRFFSLQNTVILFGLGIGFLLTVCEVVFRKRWLSFAVTGALIVIIAYPTIPQAHPQDKWFVAMFSAGIAAGVLWVMSRFGLLTLIVAMFIHLQLCAFPLTLDLNSWFSGRSWLAMAALAAVAAWGALSALNPVKAVASSG